MATRIPQPEFGRRLRRLRTERGMSQRDLAVGVVNQSYISLLESGSRVPTLEIVLHLAKVLDVPFDALVEDPEANIDGIAAVVPAVPVTEQPKAQLVEDLLTTSAIDHGDLDQAEQRLTRAYKAAISAGTPTAQLSSGLALERILDLRNDRTSRYALLTEMLPVAERLAIPEALVRVRIALSAAARDVGQLGEAFTQIEAAGQEIPNTAYVRGSEHIRLLAVRISVLSDAGGGAEVVRLVDTMLEMADALGSPPIASRAYWAASMALAVVGETERSLVHLRNAREMMANPGTSLRDWARFTRAAVSALMDANADLSEITSNMFAARAASAAEAGVDPVVMTSLEVRYAVANGEPLRALEMAENVDEARLSGIERVRFVQAVAVAQRNLGRTGASIATLRRAAHLAESASAYRRAAQIWRDINDQKPA